MTEARERITVERVCHMASGIMAASWPNEVEPLRAMFIAFKFAVVVDGLHELEMVLGVTDERTLH